jgi:hypothetical protein
MNRCTTLVLALALAAFPCAAAADPSSTAVGITLNPTFGDHESFNDIVHVPPVPAPLIEVSHRFDRFELYAVGLPPTAAIPYTDAIQGQTALRLTIMQGVFRIYSDNRRFSAGIGETIYNQTTHYAVSQDYPATQERMYSRIVGALIELSANLPFRSGTLETNLRYNPTMLGTQVTTYDSYPALTRYDPERGQQIDAQVRYVHPIGERREAILGLQYVNFTTRYDVPNRPFADRNVGLLPSFGYLWKIGR